MIRVMLQVSDAHTGFANDPQNEPDDARGGAVGTLYRFFKFAMGRPLSFLLSWMAVCASKSVYNYTCAHLCDSNLTPQLLHCAASDR